MWAACRAGLFQSCSCLPVAPGGTFDPVHLLSCWCLQVDAKTANLFEGVGRFIVDVETWDSNQNLNIFECCSDSLLCPKRTCFSLLEPNHIRRAQRFPLLALLNSVSVTLPLVYAQEPKPIF